METLTDSIPISIVTRSLSNNFSIEEKARREAAVANKDYYYDRADKYVKLVNSEVDAMVVNLVRSITKKRSSLLYSTSLVREFEGPDESITFLTDFYRFIHIDKFLYAVDIMSELTGTSLVHIAEAGNEFGIKLMLFDGSEISVLGNERDPNIADAISLIRVIDAFVEKTRGNPQVERILEQQIWTESAVSVYRTKSTASTSPKFTSTVTHNLPIMPFVPFKGEDVEGQYMGHAVATAWRQLGFSYNTMLTHLCYMIKMESATPIALAGYESGDGITLHPGKAICLPAGATASVMDFNPKIAETIEAIKYIEEQIYNSSSVPKCTIIGGDASSGRELMIQWFPLLQVFQDKKVRFSRYELQLANTILKLVELPEIDSINIKFPESSVLPLSTEEDNLERDIRLNLKSPIDELMRRNPQLTEADAEAEVRANSDFNSQITTSSQEDTNAGTNDTPTA